MNTLFCANCNRGGMDAAMTAAGHDCAVCPNTTYTAYKICVCCAVENSSCMTCGEAFESGIDESARAFIALQRVAFNEILASVVAVFDAQLADIRPDIDSWLRVNQECAAKYDAAFQASPGDWRALRDEHFAPVEAERARVGAAKLERHEHAVRARHIKTQRATRRFELEAERILGHRAVELHYTQQLASMIN